MDLLQFKKMMPLIFIGVVTVVFGLGVHMFVQAYSGYLHQLKVYDQIKTQVRLVTTRKNELISKQRILDGTHNFIKMADFTGLSPTYWTVYDINLQEMVSFDKADRILNQCASSKVAYFQPLSLQIKIPQKQTQGNDATKPDTKKDLTVSVHGKFVAKQP